MIPLGQRRPSHQRVLDHFKAHPEHSLYEAAQALEITVLTLQKYLQALKEEGAIRRECRWVVSVQ